MATGTARPRWHLRSDDLFFAGMAVVALIVVLVGFARSYFLVGLFRARLPNLLVHIHGAAFTLWIILFITQISLVTAHRVDLHGRLGLLGFVLAIVMIVLGTLTASDRLARHVAHPVTDTVEEVRAFYTVPLADIWMFSTFVYFGYRNRFQPAVHKRLMWFSTLSLLDAGFDRWSIFDPYPLWEVNLICFVPLVLATLIYDRCSTGAIQRVTIWSAAFLLATQQIRHLASQTAPWAQFAHWVGARVPFS
jgi:hypothetical protein